MNRYRGTKHSPRFKFPPKTGISANNTNKKIPNTPVEDSLSFKVKTT